MGLFKSAEEKKDIQIKKLKNQIKAYEEFHSEKIEERIRNHRKMITAIEKLEKMVGTEHLSGDYVEKLMYSYDSEHGTARDEKAIERILPAYSRHFYESELGWILKSPEERYLFSHSRLITYLIGGRYEWDLTVVICPDLDMAMEFARKMSHWEQEYDVPEDSCKGTFFQQLIEQLKEVGYPGTAATWENRIWWMLKHMENPAVGFLFDEMVDRCGLSVDSRNIRYMLSHEELENLKAYCRNEGIQNMVTKEWNRRFPADR